MNWIIGLAAMALSASAQQQQSAAQPQLRQQLRPLQFLVGSCWTGSFPDGKTTDTHCFESVYGGQFVRDTHAVRGGRPYEGETIYAWDAERETVVFTYWASNGAISTGVLSTRGRDIVIPEVHRKAGGERVLENVITPRGDDAYELIVTERTGGQGRELWRMTLRRDRR